MNSPGCSEAKPGVNRITRPKPRRGATTMVFVRPLRGRYVNFLPTPGSASLHLELLKLSPSGAVQNRIIGSKSGRTDFTQRTYLLFFFFFFLLLLLGVLTGCGKSATSDKPNNSSAPLLLVIGSRGRLPAHFSSPRGIDIHTDGRIAVADRTGRIQILSPQGESLVEWKLPAYDNGTPTGIIFDLTRPASPTLLVADTHYSRILRYSLEGELLHQFGEYGETPDKMIYPTDIALDPKGNLYITEYGLHDRVMKFSPEGRRIGQWGDFGTEPGQFQRPLGIVWTPPNRIVVADMGNHRLQAFTEEGELLDIWGEVGSGLGQFTYPYDLCANPDGGIIVCEYGNNRLQALDAQGRSIGLYGGPSRDPGGFATPWGVAAGPGNLLVVADTGNHRLQLFRTDNLFEPVAGLKVP